MFDEYKKHLEAENEWLKGQVKELQEKLWQALRLGTNAPLEGVKQRYDPDAKAYVKMTPEEVHAEEQALQDLLAQNV